MASRVAVLAVPCAGQLLVECDIECERCGGNPTAQQLQAHEAQTCIPLPLSPPPYPTEQFDDSKPAEAKLIPRFFNW
jgi:hypothetical protein